MGLIRLLFSFNGRIGRAEYLLGFVILIGGVLLWLGIMTSALRGTGLEVLGVFVVILFFWGKFALVAKRLHDLGKSGFWCLALFIPLVGLIVALMLFIAAGDEYVNHYGPAQKLALPEPALDSSAVNDRTS